jgi:hypothetical protein
MINEPPKPTVLKSVRPDDWPQEIHVHRAVIRLPNGIESGNWQTKPDGDKTLRFVRVPADATIVDRNLLHRMRTRASWQDCHDGALTIEGQANTIARLSADLDQVSADRDGMGEVVKTGREVMSIWKGRAEKAEARVKLLEAAVDHWKSIAQKEGR